MKVAFDVKGTLEGPKEVLKLFKWFESKGCEMIVWSNVYSYAVECAKNLKLDNVEVTSKRDRLYDLEELADNPNWNVDIAVDDASYRRDSNGRVDPYLACNHMITVMQIPQDESLFEETFGHLLLRFKR